jgi:hypothetical protein
MRTRLITLCLLNAALLGTVSCRRPEKHARLPEKVPTPPEIRFTAREAGWPPRPYERANVVDVLWTPRLDALTESREEELRNTALQDSRVRTALGERYAYIMAGEMDPDKERPDRATEARRVRLTFYSYSNNIPVEVLVHQRAVEQVTKRENYQPPEGPDEIKAAIALAQQEPRLAEFVQGMHATAILIYRERSQPGYGHRILHVSFTATGGEEEAPRYYALVDLTEQKTLASGPVGER